jgi:hypothetical protein
MKHADDFVLLAKEETVLRGKNDGLMQVRTIYAVKINGGKNKTVIISRKPTRKQITIHQMKPRIWNISTILVS